MKLDQNSFGLLALSIFFMTVVQLSFFNLHNFECDNFVNNLILLRIVLVNLFLSIVMNMLKNGTRKNSSLSIASWLKK